MRNLADQKKQQILAQLARLESVERRWLGSVLVSMILGSLILVLALEHLEMSHLLTDQPATIPRIQFLIVIIAIVVILFANIAAFVDYFAFSVHVERQVVITKKRRRPSATDEEDDDADPD